MFMQVKVGRYEVEVIVGAVVDGVPEYKVHDVHDTKEHHPDFESQQENIYEVKNNLQFYVNERFKEIVG